MKLDTTNISIYLSCLAVIVAVDWAVLKILAMVH
jgi:hypothetical protein